MSFVEAGVPTALRWQASPVCFSIWSRSDSSCFLSIVQCYWVF